MFKKALLETYWTQQNSLKINILYSYIYMIIDAYVHIFRMQRVFSNGGILISRQFKV